MTPEILQTLERAGTALAIVAARCSNKLTPETFAQVLSASVEVQQTIRDYQPKEPGHAN